MHEMDIQQKEENNSNIKKVQFKVSPRDWKKNDSSLNRRRRQELFKINPTFTIDQIMEESQRAQEDKSQKYDLRKLHNKYSSQAR